MTTIEEEALRTIEAAIKCRPGAGVILGGDEARAIKVMLGGRDHGPMVNKTEWVVTWTAVRPVGIIDGLSTLSSWPAVIDYVSRLVPPDATFTVKPA